MTIEAEVIQLQTDDNLTYLWNADVIPSKNTKPLNESDLINNFHDREGLHTFHTLQVV